MMGTTTDGIRKVLRGSGWMTAKEIIKGLDLDIAPCTVRSKLLQMCRRWKEIRVDRSEFTYRYRLQEEVSKDE